MLHNYLEEMNIGLEEMKDYLDMIDARYAKEADRCFLTKQLMAVFDRHYDTYLADGMQALLDAKGFDEMEHHLIMMNYFFANDDGFIALKKRIKKIILSLAKPIRAYQILRHVMDLDCMSLLEMLRSRGYMNSAQAAYCCLVEGNVERAYDYLLSLKEKPSQALLDYFYSYSPAGYFSLMRNYGKRPLALSLV